MSREFRLVDILSIITGKLISNRKNVYEILNFMSGVNPEKYDVFHLSKKCKFYLLRQHPQFRTFKMKNEISFLEWSLVNVKNKYKYESIVLNWFERQVQEYGPKLKITPILHFKIVPMLNSCYKPILPILIEKPQ